MAGAEEMFIANPFFVRGLPVEASQPPLLSTSAQEALQAVEHHGFVPEFGDVCPWFVSAICRVRDTFNSCILLSSQGGESVLNAWFVPFRHEEPILPHAGSFGTSTC